MKTSKLLTTTMLVSAAAMIAAVPASAAKLKLGGYYEQWIGAGGKGTADPNEQFDIQNDAEIFFSFKEKLSNGMTAGGRFELEAGTGQTTKYDESSLYLSGAFGKILIGNNDAAASGAASIKVVGPVGHIKSDRADWVGVNTTQHDFDTDLGSSDAQLIMYTTPKVNGLQLSASYAPDNSDGTNSDMDDRETSGVKNTVSGLLKYSTQMGASKVSVGLGMTTNKLDNQTQDGWALGVGVSQGPVSVTVGYGVEEFTATDERTFMGAGLIYKLDKVNSVSVGFSQGKKKTNTAASDLEENIATIGFSRNLGKGVSFQASAFNVDTNHGTSTTNVNENGLVGGVKVSF